MKLFQLFKFSTNQRKIIFLGLFLVLIIGVLAPSYHPAQAIFGINLHSIDFIGSWLSSMGKSVANGIIFVIFIILSTIATTFLELSQIIFNWVTSPGFIGFSFTGPDNYIVTEGWKMMRNFADTFILIGLLFTGLATAFNVAGYNTKKGLLRLLVVALLINFTPVFCGVIIDGANFFTNAFLEKSLTISQGWGETMGDQWASMSASLKSNTGEVLGKAMVILVFDLVSTFVFLIFAALFALRYVVLWLLIIFSPLAFLAWAFPDIPKVKGLFEQWWQNFISWSIIGVPAAIVIYLSDKLIQIAKMGNLTGRSSSLEEVSPGIAGDIATYGVPLIFLIVGFLTTLSVSAQGSSMVVGLAKSVGKKVGGAVGVGGKALGRRAMQGASSRAMGAAAGAKQAALGAKRYQKPLLALKGALTGAFNEETIESGKTQAEQWATRGGKSPFGYAQRAMGRSALAMGLKTEQRNYDAKTKKAEALDMMTNASRYQNAGKLGQLAILANESKQGRLDKFVKAAKIEPEAAAGLYRSAIHLRDKDTQKAIERHFSGKMGEQFGTISQNLGRYTVEQQEIDRREKGYTSYTDKIVDETKTVDAIKQLGASLKASQPNAKNIMEGMHKFWGGSQIEEASKNHGRKFTQPFQASSHPPQWYLTIDQNTGKPRNPDGAFYRASTAAQKSGAGFVEEVSVKDLKEKLTKHRIILPPGVKRETPRIEPQKGGFVASELPKTHKTKKSNRPENHDSKKHWWNDYQKT